MRPTTLDPAAEQALAERCREVVADPARIRVRFPAAAREIARTPGTSPAPGGDRIEDRVRVRLLDALAQGLPDPDARAAEVRDLYRYGDADERRAVLLALPRLGLHGRVVDLLHDALRTNDPRLVAAALGPYAATYLDDEAWRQGVLKCLFVGVPLRLVDGVDQRADDELRRMVADYADERRAAGRPVPDDALPLLTSRET
ncbi:EboA domain-containing protein [Nocardioides donggukensis]|uniref:EboA domain-containing protein n=1 Tax=Nocardioides donggukensis TaxID=2774019 RepID=A0A927K7X2_9ACTN|nr:EboA domain-containing protein [Nocardioides donggukensis]MBD8870638.1 EboA domain-containing protein [Nocardioides donggukensis]